MFCVVLLINLFVLIIDSVKKVVLYRGKNAVYKFIKTIHSEYSYCREVIKKHLNKNLIMSTEEKERFEPSTFC